MNWSLVDFVYSDAPMPPCCWQWQHAGRLLLLLLLLLGVSLAMTPQNLNQCLTKNVHLVARSLATFLRSGSRGFSGWGPASVWLVNDWCGRGNKLENVFQLKQATQRQQQQHLGSALGCIALQVACCLLPAAGCCCFWMLYQRRHPQLLLLLYTHSMQKQHRNAHILNQPHTHTWVVWGPKSLWHNCLASVCSFSCCIFDCNRWLMNSIHTRSSSLTAPVSIWPQFGVVLWTVTVCFKVYQLTNLKLFICALALSQLRLINWTEMLASSAAACSAFGLQALHKGPANYG